MNGKDTPEKSGTLNKEMQNTWVKIIDYLVKLFKICTTVESKTYNMSGEIAFCVTYENYNQKGNY